ncbi:hypothetical protein PPC_1322 [Pseudomonas protegens Cab57]|nr:hypothetical protein PPC_1322 [Pseudomonas protegens Cab57]
MFQDWQPARLRALATAAATPNRGRKCEKAGEAMAKLLRGGSVDKGATLVSRRVPRKRGQEVFLDDAANSDRRRVGTWQNP